MPSALLCCFIVCSHSQRAGKRTRLHAPPPPTLLSFPLKALRSLSESSSGDAAGAAAGAPTKLTSGERAACKAAILKVRNAPQLSHSEIELDDCTGCAARAQEECILSLWTSYTVFSLSLEILSLMHSSFNTAELKLDVCTRCVSPSLDPFATVACSHTYDRLRRSRPTSASWKRSMRRCLTWARPVSCRQDRRDDRGRTWRRSWCVRAACGSRILAARRPIPCLCWQAARGM